MIFLLNTDRVISEIVELSKIRISAIIGCGPEDIRVDLEIVDGKLRVNIKAVAADNATTLEEESIKRAISEYWGGKARPELIARMKGLKECRRGGEEEKAQES